MLNDHDYYFYFVQIAVTPEVLQYASRYLQILILASSALTIVRDVDVVPMVLSQVAAIFHGSPVLPVLLSLIDRGSPDLLSPNDILEVESVAVPHAPLGDFFSRKGSRTAGIRTHEVSCKTAAMVRRSRTRAVSLTSNFPDPTRKLIHHRLGSVDRNLLASTNSWDRGCRISPEACGSRRAAFHLRRSRTLVASRGASAIRAPAAVS